MHHTISTPSSYALGTVNNKPNQPVLLLTHIRTTAYTCSMRQRLMPTSNRMLQKSSYAGCSKMLRCKARNIMRNEAYFFVRRRANDERTAADVLFSTG